MIVSPDIRAVLFDLDGTLLDHDRARDAAIEAVLTAQHSLGEPQLQAMLDHWQRISEVLYEQYLAGELSFQQQRLGRIKRFSAEVLDLGVGEDDDAAQQVFDQYQRHYQRRWKAFDDVAPAVARLARAGVAMAVVTNGADQQQKRKAARIGLDHLPVLTSAAAGVSKPDPRIFFLACAEVDQPPEACLMVGDNPVADVLGAQNSGLAAVLLDRQGTAGPEHAHLPTITTLSELF